MYTSFGNNHKRLILRQFSDFLDKKTYVKKQDLFQVVSAISKNPSGRHAAWYFYRKHWNDLVSL